MKARWYPLLLLGSTVAGYGLGQASELIGQAATWVAGRWLEVHRGR